MRIGFQRVRAAASFQLPKGFVPWFSTSVFKKWGSLQQRLFSANGLPPKFDGSWLSLPKIDKNRANQDKPPSHRCRSSFKRAMAAPLTKLPPPNITGFWQVARLDGWKNCWNHKKEWYHIDDNLSNLFSDNLYKMLKCCYIPSNNISVFLSVTIPIGMVTSRQKRIKAQADVEELQLR